MFDKLIDSWIDFTADSETISINDRNGFKRTIIDLYNIFKMYSDKLHLLSRSGKFSSTQCLVICDEINININIAIAVIRERGTANINNLEEFNYCLKTLFAAIDEENGISDVILN